MGAIHVHEFVSLDGVFEDPTWTFEFGFTDDAGQAMRRLTDPSAAILLGRTTWEMFAPAWRDRTVEDDPGAPFFNDSPKHVVSRRSIDPDTWAHSTGLGAYDPQAVRALKDDVDGDIFVSGSGTLVRALLADGLVDDLHLFVYPVVLGAGARLFPEGSARLRLLLTDQERLDNGAVHLTYTSAS